MQWFEVVRVEAESGKPVLRGLQTIKGKFWDKLQFLPTQLSPKPVDYYRESISAETMLGRLAEQPIELHTPVLIAAMSYGALSKEAKLSLAKASTLAGTATNTGEGGMLKEERELAKVLIFQYSTGRFGASEEAIKCADAIEIKLGQGAKGGFGGMLPASKVDEEIAKFRGVEPGQDIHSPPSHPDIQDWKGLREKVKWIKELTGGKPVIVKLAAGRIEADLRAVLRSKPDAIALDGTEGGTGAAPLALTHACLPSALALVRARQYLDRKGVKQELWIGGGLRCGVDVAKALALGADAVFMGTAMLVAMGCVLCGKCYEGICPRGIATHCVELRSKLNVEQAARKVANFIQACTEEVKMIAASCGRRSVHELSATDLCTLNPQVAELLGVQLA